CSTALLAAVLLALGGCTTIVRRPVPESLIDSVHVVGMPDHIRAWGDRESEAIHRSLSESVEQAKRAYGDEYPLDGLFISSGGTNGAYAAGVLCGWTQHGTRPEFRVVSGVSIGAIIAPFAFLGSEFDERLEDIARCATQENIYCPHWWPGWLIGDSITDN